MLASRLIEHGIIFLLWSIDVLLVHATHNAHFQRWKKVDDGQAAIHVPIQKRESRQLNRRGGTAVGLGDFVDV